MSEYAELRAAVKTEITKNDALQSQICQRFDEMLRAFWERNPMLRSVNCIELSPNVMSDWVNRHLPKQG